MNDAIYTPAQASAVADLPLKAVHKLIDGRLIRPRRRRVGRETQRFLSQDQLVYLRLEAEGVKLLLARWTELRVIKDLQAIPRVAIATKSA